MTLSEAIEHALEVGRGSCPCSEDHRQLAMWLMELQNHRRSNLRTASREMDKQVDIEKGRIRVNGRPTGQDTDHLAQLLWDLVDMFDPHVNAVLQRHGVEFQHEDGSVVRPQS